jgi:hypothetical protein
MPINDKLFVLQAEVIKDYAKEGSCVIIGRCADYVLRDEENVFRIFIYGDLEHRKARVAQRHPEIKSSQIIDVINKTDRRRASYYNFYTGNKWGKYDNYDIAINSSTLGILGTAKIIARCAEKLMQDCPYYTVHSIPAGTYDGQTEDVNTVTVKATLIVSASASEDDVYAITKAIFDNIDDITKAHAKGAELSIENATSGMTAPFHKGAAKYFAEKGVTVDAE